MKRALFITMALFFILAQTGFSQDPDTSKVRIGKKQYTVIVDGDKEIRIVTDEDSDLVIKEEKQEKHRRPMRRMDGTWEGFEFGLTNFLNADYQLELPSNAGFLDPKMAESWGMNFNFAEKSLGLVKNYFGLVTGLGLEYQRYMFVNDFDLVKGVNGIEAGPVDLDFYKNRLSVWHLNVPLMAEFQIPVYGEHNRIKISAGVVGGLRLGSRQVQKYRVDDEKQKIKTKDDFYLRDFRYGFTARVGYGDLMLFANYYPQTLFKDGKGPGVYPVTVGIHFGG